MKYRSRLLSKHVEAIICTYSWKHGFCEYDNFSNLNSNIIFFHKQSFIF